MGRSALMDQDRSYPPAVPSHVAELAINHTRGGIEAVYDRHRYELA
jgi:hypothetical protein